eukprot:COSAG06_NODE_957_length_11322_cov_9.239686_9_plen_101_part_00
MSRSPPLPTNGLYLTFLFSTGTAYMITLVARLPSFTTHSFIHSSTRLRRPRRRARDTSSSSIVISCRRGRRSSRRGLSLSLGLGFGWLRDVKDSLYLTIL